MDLNDLIPDNRSNWNIGKKYLHYRKYNNIPFSYIEDDIVYIFMDLKIKNEILKYIKWIRTKGFEFYLLSPALSNPKGIDDWKSEVIRNYFYCYTQLDFFYGLNKIDFDLIDNMVKWSIRNDCFNLIKTNFDDILKDVNSSYWCYYEHKRVFNYPIEIRDDFRSLYRDILINRLI